MIVEVDILDQEEDYYIYINQSISLTGCSLRIICKQRCLYVLTNTAIFIHTVIR